MIATMINTMIVDTMVSLRDVHVTFCASLRTCCINASGLTFFFLFGGVRSLAFNDLGAVA